MMCFEYLGSGWQHHISQGWGSCRRVVEVLDDQMAARQVDLYENGFVLKYDRQHARDEFGILIALKFSRKDKWRKYFKGVQTVSQSEFDKLWKNAVRKIPRGTNQAFVKGSDGNTSKKSQHREFGSGMPRRARPAAAAPRPVTPP